jgi:hypothetical protein
MTQTQSGPGENQSSPAVPKAEPLGLLYKMSPTAGVATTDYASINSIAIVTIILGVASTLCMLNPILLFLPIAGAICGVVALRKILDSNGTQVGRGLAWTGLAASLLFGGGVAGVQIVRSLQTRAQEREVSAVIETIGQDIRDDKYDAVYALSSPRLQARVTPEEFRKQLSSLNIIPQLGRLEYLRWNGNSMIFQINPDTGDQHCVAMALEKMQQLPEPGREIMGFAKVSGQWLLEDLPRLFPAAQPPKKQ